MREFRSSSFRPLGLGAALALALCVPAQAAGTAGSPAAPPATPSGAPVPEQQAADQALALAVKRLTLSPDQTAKVKPLLDAHVRKLRRLFADYTGAGANVMPSFLQEFRKTREDFRASVRPILTEPQRGQFEQLRSEVDEALRDQICDLRVASLDERLALTPEQQAALRPILKDDFDQKRALLGMYTGPTGGPEARRWLTSEAGKVQAATEGKMATVLNPDQLKTYRADLAAKIEAAEAAQP